MKKLLTAFALVAATGCARAPSVDEVQEGVEKAATTVGEQGGAGITGTSNMEMTSSVLGGISTVSGLSRLDPGAMDPRRVFDAMDPRRLELVAAPLRSLDKGETRMAQTSDPGASFRQQMQDLGHFLRTRIFIEENVEERTGDATIFRIEGDDVCTAGDTSCIDSFNRFEVRLSATRDIDSLDVTLLAGPERHAPYRVQLSDNFMSASTDLNEVRKTYLYVAQVTGQVNEDLPDVMQGQLELRAERHGEKDYSLAFHIHQAVLVETTRADAGGLYRYTVAAKSPLARIRYNDVEKRLEGQLDLGTVEYGYPYSPVISASGNAGDRMLSRFAGASFSFNFREGDTSAEITNIGLGDSSTIEQLDSTVLRSVDLNASAGRRFTLRVTPNASGAAVTTVSPGFDLSVMNFREPLTVDSDVYVAPYEMNETLRYQLSGSSPTVEDVPPDYEAGFYGALKVVSGTLTLSTTADYPAVVVQAGQCLSGRATPPEGSHGLLGNYEVIACP